MTKRAMPARVELICAKVAARAGLPASLVLTRGPSHGHRIALTFDDGQTNLTPDYLAVQPIDAGTRLRT